MQSHGQAITIPIPATTSGFVARDALVNLPPAGFERPRPQLPVTELLAGEPGASDNSTQGGLADVTSDAYAKTHLGLAPVLVMADNNGTDTADTECVGKVERYLTVDVPRFVPAANAVSVTTCSMVVPGGEHTFQVWTAVFKASLPWVAARLGIGPPVTTCPHQ